MTPSTEPDVDVVTPAIDVTEPPPAAPPATDGENVAAPAAEAAAAPVADETASVEPLAESVEPLSETAPVELQAETAPAEPLSETAPVEPQTETAPAEPVAEAAPAEPLAGAAPVEPLAGSESVDEAPSEGADVPVAAPPAEPLPTAAQSDWGRVDEAGTVFVRTVDGEREVGSWQAGTAEEGLAHFARRYEVLSTEVALLEQRLRTGVGDPQQVAQSATRLKSSVPSAAAVGDLGSLERRVDGILAATAEAVEAGKAKKAEARARAAEAKRALAEEVEAVAESSSWRDAGERLRTVGDDWKRLPHLDKRTEDELWQRVAAARKRFTERRSAHFGALEQQREVSRERKEKLISQAESLASSTEWGPTAGVYKQLMGDWKSAGRAPREVEDELWTRFKAAQDVFFTARNAHFSEQDEELRGNQQVKEQILVEAETIDPAQGVDKAKARLRTLQERWESAGKVPRDVMRSLEGRMAAVEEKVRTADEVKWRRTEESPFTVRLREKVAELEGKLDKARTAGRPTEELEAALTTQRQWLAQADSGGASATSRSSEAPAPRKKATTAWVRAD